MKDIFADITKKLKQTQTGARSIRLMHPRRDWLIGLCGGAVILVACVIWSSYVYVSYRSDDAIEVSAPDTAPPAYNASLVAAAQTYFDDRAQVFAETSGVVFTPSVTPPAEPPRTTATSSDEAATSTNTSTPATTTPDGVPPRPPVQPPLPPQPPAGSAADALNAQADDESPVLSE